MKQRLKSIMLVALLLPMTAIADKLAVTFHYIGPTEGQAWLGVNQGVHEANRQGRFLNQSYSLEVVAPEELDTVDISTVLLLAVDDVDILAIAQKESLTNVPVINITSTTDALRETCLKNLFHVTPSEKMRADALAQWQARNPDTAVTIQSWHPDFFKFAASQLNNRFKENQGEAMLDDGWAGWAAAKMVADTVVQTNQSDAQFMLNHLKKDLIFDGQKGENTNYRDNGQLRQILLVISEEDEILAEAPLRGVQGGLDSLGQTSCQ